MTNDRSAKAFALLMSLCVATAVVLATGQSSQGLDPAQLLKPLADSWPSYSGDYTGRRYSALTQADGTHRSFRTIGNTPAVEVHDPLQPHKDLLRVYSDADIHNVTAFLVTLK